MAQTAQTVQPTALVGAGDLRDPVWRARLTWCALGLLLLWPLLQTTEFKPWTMLDPRSLRVTGRFIASCLPPSIQPDFLLIVARETWRTIAIATTGVTLGLAIALPLALWSTASLSVSSLGRTMAAIPLAARQSARAAMVALRTVPELVWALVFVRVVGLGPTAGVLAIALTYGGMLGKVFAEIFESCSPEPTKALLSNGAGRLQAFFYGLLPQAAAELTSYSVYRWECAIRSSVVLGFVGAGGLGQQMDSSLKMLNGAEVSTMLLVFIALVALADALSAWLRKALR
jgi:phosphonate transport system permease protein